MATDKARAAGGSSVMHRLQIGIAGIFAVLVMVALADMLLQRVGSEVPMDDVTATQPGEIIASPPPVVQAPAASEPLVDLGVVPDLPADGAQHSAGGQTPLVGELQPNPEAGTQRAPQQ